MIDIAYIMIILALVVSFAPAALGGLRNARGIFIAYSLLGIFIPFITALIVGHGERGQIVEINSADGFYALFLCSIGFFAAIFTSIYRERNDERRKIGAVFNGDASTAKIFSALSLMFSLGFALTLVYRFGRASEAIERLYQRTSLNDSVANASFILSFGGFVFSIFAMTFAREQKGNAIFYATISALACLVVSMASGGRTTVGLFFVAIFYTSFLKMKFRRAAIYLLSFSLLFIVVSYAIVNLRYEAQGSRNSIRAEAGVAETAFTGLTYVDHVAASIEYAREKGRDNGALYINTLFLPIPRDYWKEKPLQISVEMRDFLYGDITGGNPPGIFGEAYIAFGAVGVLVAGMSLGWMLGVIDAATSVALRYDCRVRSAIVGIFAPLVAFVLVRGGVDIGAIRLGIPAFWCFIAVLICRRLSAQARQRPSNTGVRGQRRPNARRRLV